MCAVFVCLYVFVCVCVRKRERERERACVCVCEGSEGHRAGLGEQREQQHQPMPFGCPPRSHQRTPLLAAWRLALALVWRRVHRGRAGALEWAGWWGGSVHFKFLLAGAACSLRCVRPSPRAFRGVVTKISAVLVSLHYDSRVHRLDVGLGVNQM